MSGKAAKPRNGVITLTIKVHKEDDAYLASCEELGVSTFGHSHEEAQEAIREAVLLYLNTIEEEGERERIFKKRGIKVLSQSALKKVRTVRVEAHLDECVMPSAFPVGKIAAASGV